MESNPNATFTAPTAAETHHKKATTAMVLSIIGLVLFVLPGFNLVGLVLSIVGFVQSVSNRKLAKENEIQEDSLNTAGYTCGLIGIIAGGLSVLLTVLAFVLFIVIGVSVLTMAGPVVGTALSESMPYVEDALEQALPGALSTIGTFLTAV